MAEERVWLTRDQALRYLCYQDNLPLLVAVHLLDGENIRKVEIDGEVHYWILVDLAWYWGGLLHKNIPPRNRPLIDPNIYYVHTSIHT